MEEGENGGGRGENMKSRQWRKCGGGRGAEERIRKADEEEMFRWKRKDNVEMEENVKNRKRKYLGGRGKNVWIGRIKNVKTGKKIRGGGRGKNVKTR